MNLKRALSLIIVLFALDVFDIVENGQNERKMRLRGRVRKRHSRADRNRRYGEILPLCPFNSTITDSDDVLFDVIRASKYIFTGKVLSIRQPKSARLGKSNGYLYKIYIRRVLKGDIEELQRLVRFEAKPSKNLNGATVYVQRDGDESRRCSPAPRVRYSAIFLADRDSTERKLDYEDEAYDGGGNTAQEVLKLVIDPIPLSLYHLDKVIAAVKGKVTLRLS